jgi:multiple sugar transport system substrate-binding protein
MYARDCRAAIAVIGKLSEVLRHELGDDAQAMWPVLGALLQDHLSDKVTTITALADASGLPRTSARRLVFALKAKGWLQFRPLSGTGNRATVVPSAALLERLDSITEQTIRLIVGASHTHSVDRFDAASLAPAPDIAWPRAALQGFNDAIELTLIAYEDPVFDIVKHNRAEIERFLGVRLRVLTYPQDAYRQVLDHALKGEPRVEETAPLLAAIPFPWLAESSRHGHLLELQALHAGGRFSGADFYDAVWRAGWSNGQLYAIPLQPTLDFLWYRQDLFEAEGLSPPCTFEDVVHCARRLQRPSQERAGITWCAAPGLPLAETFLQILGAQGALSVDEDVLHIDSEAGRRVVEYLRELIAYSPVQLRSLHWVRNAQIFGSGRAAMCYHWSNRYGMLDSHALLQKGGRIGLQLHPTFAPGMKAISPLGGALLAIPSRNAERAAKSAWNAVETLTSPELMKYFVLHGAAGNARHSVAEDRYVLQRNRIIAVMDRLAKTDSIRAFPWPAAPRYHDLTQVLSDGLQGLLFDGVSDIRQGLGKLQDALASTCRDR